MPSLEEIYRNNPFPITSFRQVGKVESWPGEFALHSEVQRAREYLPGSVTGAAGPDRMMLGVSQGVDDLSSILFRAIEAGANLFGAEDVANRAKYIAEESIIRNQARDIVATERYGDGMSKYFQGGTRSLTNAGGAALMPGPSTPWIIAEAAANRGNQAIYEADRAGLDGLDHFKYVAQQAGIEGGITSIFQRLGAGGFESALSGSPIRAGIKEALKSAGKNALAELPEEVVIELFDSMTQEAYGMKNPTPEDIKNTVKDTVLQTLATVGMASTPGVARAGVDSLEDRHGVVLDNQHADAVAAAQAELQSQYAGSPVQPEEAQQPATDTASPEVEQQSSADGPIQMQWDAGNFFATTSSGERVGEVEVGPPSKAEAGNARRMFPGVVPEGETVARFFGADVDEKFQRQGIGSIGYLTAMRKSGADWFYNSQAEEPAVATRESLVRKGFIENRWWRDQPGGKSLMRLTEKGKQFADEIIKSNGGESQVQPEPVQQPEVPSAPSLTDPAAIEDFDNRVWEAMLTVGDTEGNRNRSLDDIVAEMIDDGTMPRAQLVKAVQESLDRNARRKGVQEDQPEVTPPSQRVAKVIERLDGEFEGIALSEITTPSRKDMRAAGVKERFTEQERKEIARVLRERRAARLAEDDELRAKVNQPASAEQPLPEPVVDDDPFGPEPETEPKPETAQPEPPAEMTRPRTVEEFAGRISEYIEESPISPIRKTRRLLSDVYSDLGGMGMSREEFNQMLFDASKRGYLTLAASDMPGLYDARKLAESEFVVDGEKYHFLRSDKNRDSIRFAPQRSEPDVPLDDFASMVLTIANNTPVSRRFGENKTFLKDVFEGLKETGLSRRRITRMLIDANRKDLITLSRADLTSAMSPEIVEQSEINDDDADYHFVRTDRQQPKPITSKKTYSKKSVGQKNLAGQKKQDSPDQFNERDRTLYEKEYRKMKAPDIRKVAELNYISVKKPSGKGFATKAELIEKLLKKSIVPGVANYSSIPERIAEHVEDRAKLYEGSKKFGNYDIRELHDLVAKPSGMSLGQLHDLLREMDDSGRIKLVPWKGSISDLNPQQMVVVKDGQAMHTVEPGDSSVKIKSLKYKPPRNEESMRKWMNDVEKFVNENRLKTNQPTQLKDIYKQFGKPSGMTRGEFEDGMRRLSKAGRIRLRPWTGSMAEADHDSGFYIGKEFKQYADPIESNPTFDRPSGPDRTLKGEKVGYRVEEPDTPRDPKKPPTKRRDAQEAIEALGEAYGSSVAHKRGFVPEGVGGRYYPRSKTIRLADARDTVTAAHEQGHDMYFDLLTNGGITDRDTRRELATLGSKFAGGKMDERAVHEGFAEYIAEDLHGPRAGQRPIREVMPNTAKLIDGILSETPGLRKAYDKARELTSDWMTQGAQARLRGNRIDTGSLEEMLRKSRGKLSVANAIEQMAESLLPLRDLQKSANSKSPNAPQIYDISKARRNAENGMVANWIENGIYDPTTGGRMFRTRLRDAQDYMKTKDDPQLLRDYIQAKRTLELIADGKKTADTERDALAIIEMIENNQDHDNIVRAAEIVWNWNRGILRYVARVSPRIMGPIVDRFLRASNQQFYVSFERDIDSKGGRAFEGQQGSTREIKDMLTTMISSSTKRVREAHRMATIEQLQEIDQIQGMGYFVEDVTKQSEMPVETEGMEIEDKIRAYQSAVGDFFDVKVNVDDVGSEVKLETKYDRSREYQYIAVPVARQNRGKDESPDKSPAYRILEVKTEIYDAIMNDPKGIYGWDRTAKWAAMPIAFSTRVFKTGAVVLNIPFNLISNPVVDYFAFITRSESGAGLLEKTKAYWGSYALSLLRAGGELVGSEKIRNAKWNKPFQFWEANGGAMAQSFADEIGVSRRRSMNLFKAPPQTVAGKIIQTVDPRNWSTKFDMLVDVLQAPETGPRVAEIKLLAKKNGIDLNGPMTEEDVLSLMLAGKEITTDFSAAGHFGKVINQLFPFVNANVQGWRADVRMLRDGHAGKFAMKQLLRFAPLATMAFAYWMMNKDEEWWTTMPPHERYRYFFVPLPGADRIMRFPMPQNAAWIAATIPATLADAAYRRDPDVVNEWLGEFVNQNKPSMPPLVKEILEQVGNEDSFSGRPIVPRNLSNKPRDEQYNEYTTDTARFLAGLFDLSPARVEHAIRSGGAMGIVLDAPDTVARALGISNRERPRAPAEVPGMPFSDTLMRRGGKSGTRTKTMSTVYEKLEEFTLRKNSSNHFETPTEIAERRIVEDAANAISDLSFIRSQTKDRDVRNKLTDRAQAIAKDVLKRLKTGELDRIGIHTEMKLIEDEKDEAEIKRLKKEASATTGDRRRSLLKKIERLQDELDSRRRGAYREARIKVGKPTRPQTAAQRAKYLEQVRLRKAAGRARINRQ